jgi:hypothetical protein
MTCGILEIAILNKADQLPLTKHISLDADGFLISDSSCCKISHGTAARFEFSDIEQLGETIDRFGSHQAIALGRLRPDLCNQVEITTKRKLNGSSTRIIARTKEFLIYRPDETTLALIDYDRKGMPAQVAERIECLGGLEGALACIIPEITRIERLIRASTSAGLWRRDTGQLLPGSGGQHLFLKIKNGSDIERFLKTLHARAWLAGLGWMMVGAGGQLLERSIVDRVVGSPERLIFEGAPVLDPPLAQDKAKRHSIAIEGGTLDSIASCPPLTLVENAKLDELRKKEATRLESEVEKVRKSFIAEQAQRLAERTGMARRAADQVIERQCHGVLLPNVLLPFDDTDLQGCTVSDVLADPDRFEDATLADPLEGPQYGAGKAKILRRIDGWPWIHSFAHGRTTYSLKYDKAAVAAALNATPKDEVAKAFVRLVLAADVDPDEIEELRSIAAVCSGVGKRILSAMLKQARSDQNAREREEQRERELATRQDPRPRLPAPLPEAEWIPQMAALNEVLSKIAAPEPPMRDVEGFVVQVRNRRTPKTHAFTALGANDEETEETRLPPPDLPLLTRLNDIQLGEMIERYIEYVDDDGRPVHLGKQFVLHYQVRDDDALPLAVAVATLPIVFGDGTLLFKRGLDRDHGIVFRVQPGLIDLLPKKEECTDGAIAEAMHFLCDEWLCDVATDYTGKCILIVAALTIIERSLLPDRPTFWVTAGRRGGGKTTTLIMLIKAVTGINPPAAAWSPNEEERRKALLSYFMEALACVVWDNIPRGSQISCPHIEKSCTTAMYSDRKLGVNEIIAVAAALIHFFTGNNIGPRGDLASRSLQARIEVGRRDPENRKFKHFDPIGWTDAQRGKILRSLYTILLGNPRFHGSRKPPETRFKMWWALVGHAVEHAAQKHYEHAQGLTIDTLPNCAPEPISFKELFLAQEEDDEDSASLGDALAVFVKRYRKDDRGTFTFKAADVAKTINRGAEGYATDEEKEQADTLRDFLFPSIPPNQPVNAKALGKRLRRHVADPVAYSNKILVLRGTQDSDTKNWRFYVETKLREVVQ